MTCLLWHKIQKVLSRVSVGKLFCACLTSTLMRTCIEFTCVEVYAAVQGKANIFRCCIDNLWRWSLQKKMGILICDRFVSLFYKSLEFYFLPLLNSTVKFTQCYTPIPRLTSPCCSFFLRIKFPRTKSQTPLDDAIKDNYDYRSNDIGNREIVSCTVSEIQWLACHCPCRIFIMPGNRGLRYWTTAGCP